MPEVEISNVPTVLDKPAKDDAQHEGVAAEEQPSTSQDDGDDTEK